MGGFKTITAIDSGGAYPPPKNTQLFIFKPARYFTSTSYTSGKEEGERILTAKKDT